MASSIHSIFFISVLIYHASSIHTGDISMATDTISSVPSDVYFQDGDIILGGFFPLHTYDEISRECTTIRESKALKLIEAMVFAVQYINTNTTLLPGLKLGFEIYDSCYSDIWTLKKALNFMPPEVKLACWEENGASETGSHDINCLHHKRVAGVVGSQKSASSSELAILLGLYQIPQVSYLSTIDSLSKVTYPYFLRVVPSDRHQVNAIMDIIQYYGWTYVSLLFSDDEYGESGYHEFSKQAGANNNVCLAYTREISTRFSEQYYDDVVANLLTDPYNRAVAVVLFAHLEEARMVLSAVERNQAVGVFTFIASDGVGNFGRQGLEGFEEAAMGMMTVVPFSERFSEFDLFFFDSLNAYNPNPWTKEYLTAYDEKCEFYGLCGNDTDLPSPHETLVIDSVFAFAYALSSMLNTECNSTENLTDCALVGRIDGPMLRSYLKEITFMSLANGQVAFDDNGDGYVRYKIRNLNKVLGVTSFKDVGSWEEYKVLDIKDSSVRFYTNDTGGLPFTIPLSVCSSPCPMGFRKEFFDNENKCCWHCLECDDNAAVSNDTQCNECIPPEWPDANRTECIPVNASFMSWGTAEGTVVIITACVALSEATLVLVFYFTQFKQRIVRQSDPVLCAFLHAGVILAIVAALSSTFQPSPEICVVTRMVPSIAYALIFAPFALKTARLYRVFFKAMQTGSEEKADLLGIRRQLLILGMVWAMEISISVAWIIIFPPEVSYQFLPSGEVARDGISEKLIIACNIQLYEGISEICFSVILLLVTLAFSVLARQLPDNYHEAQFCTFASAGSILVFIGAYAAEFGTTNSTVSFGPIMYRALGMISTSILIMSCIFFPKMYVIFFVRGDINDVMLRKRQSITMAGYRVRSSTASSVSTLKGNGAGGAGRRRSHRRSKSACSDLNSIGEQAVELTAICTTLN